MNSNRKIIYNFAIYIIFFLLIIFIFSQKVDFHMDELLTYNLANEEAWFNPENGVKFTPAEQPFIDAISSDGKINLKNVWQQQINDTHPPFYYILVHIVCTIFPNSFSIWYAAAVNIFFQMLILWMLRKIVLLITKSPKIVFIISLFYIFSAGILSITSFLRMYIMSMFWVTALVYLVLKQVENEEKRYLLLTCIVSICGTLTHYYFVVFAFFLSVTYIAITFLKRTCKKGILNGITMLTAEAVSLMIFPAMFRHIFLTGRGTESIKNLSTSNLWEELVQYYKIINKDIFGGILVILILFFALVCVLATVNKGKRVGIGENELSNYLLMLVPSVCYVLVIAKTAPFNVNRYISLVYPVLIICSMSLLYVCFKCLISKEKYCVILQSVVMLIITSIGLLNCEWEYLYHENNERIENASIYGSGTHAICFYTYFWDLNTAFKEVSNCESVRFYNASTYEDFVSNCNVDEIEEKIALFFVGYDMEPFAGEFLEKNPEYEIVLDNGKYEYVHSVYLKRK